MDSWSLWLFPLGCMPAREPLELRASIRASISCKMMKMMILIMTMIMIMIIIIILVIIIIIKWIIINKMNLSVNGITNRGYYTVVQRYEFYFWVAKQYFTNERSEWVKYCFCNEKVKSISSSPRVMFFLFYRQKDIDKIIEGNDRNYVIDKLTFEIMENKPLGSWM